MLNTLIFSMLIACGKKADNGEEADLANGESIYNTNCMACHSSNGVDIVYLSSSLDDTQLSSVITDGIGGMPAQSSLSESDVTDVVAYIRSQE